MGNKQSYNLNVVFAKFKCITDFLKNNTGNCGDSMTRRWMLILMTGICGAMGGTAAQQADGCVV